MGAGDPRGYYEVLGLRRTASAAEVRAAFRERAKRYHPDRAGSAADEARFRRLREAFETLRDPQLRLRYDAEALAGEQRGGLGGNADAPDPVKATSGAAQGWDLATILAQWQRQSGRAGVALLILSTLLLASLILLVVVWYRLDRQDRLIAELGQRLRSAPVSGADMGDAAALPELAEDRPFYRAELVFPRGSAEFGPVHGERVAATVRELHDVIASLPSKEGWLVLVTGHSRRVVDPRGEAARAWALTVRRLEVTTDYLVHQGVPTDRIAARFNAGPRPTGSTSSLPEAIQLSLLCCGTAVTAEQAN
jgi:curved DNA-binding protein CbpA